MSKSDIFEVQVFCAPFLPGGTVGDDSLPSSLLGSVFFILGLDLRVGVKLLNGALGGFWSLFGCTGASSDFIAGLLESLQLWIVVHEIRIVLHTIIGILLVEGCQFGSIVGRHNSVRVDSLELTLLLCRGQHRMVNSFTVQSGFLVPLSRTQNWFNLNVLVF